MDELREYRRKEKTTVAAVKLDLETEGFTYTKWGAVQRCKRGDWLVQSRGDTYTVDADSFDRTYRRIGPGLYEKSALVWAERASQGGAIRTKEGTSDYRAGDYLVFNDRQRRDGYAISAETFGSLYEPVDGNGAT